MASRSPARLLITASTPQAVETLAGRIQGIGPRAQFPFVMTSAGGLPTGAPALRDHCARLLDPAAGTFSERLFYRLNIIHLVYEGAGAPELTLP